MTKNKTKMSLKQRKDNSFLAVKYTVLFALLVILLFPFSFMINKSLMGIADVNASIVRFFPSHITFENYSVFGEYAKYFLNSFIVVAINMFFVPLTSCLVAFPLAKYRFKGRDLMFSLILATSMIPASVLQVPQYFLFVRLNLVNKLASLYIGSFLGGGGMQIFLIIQFMRGIFDEICDAARIDGANKLVIFVRIVLPMCLNVCIYIGITVAIAKWNDFQGPLIYLREDSKRTMAVAFFFHFGSSGDASLLSNVKMAMAVCMTIFPSLLFLIFQKQMIGGVKIGGIKG